MFLVNAKSQNTFIIDELMERYMESVEENDDVDMNLVREKFEFRLENPLNINTCDEEELRNLEILSEQQLKSFFEYRNNLGKLISIYELQAIPYFDLNTIYLISPLVKIGDYGKDYHVSLMRMLNSSKKSIYLKSKTILEDKAGYISSNEKPAKYAGNKLNFYSRLKMKYENRMDIGIIAEKDPGELFFEGYNKQGFDYYSGHFFLYKYKNWLKELNIGDYTISLGQGLILHNDFGRGKSALVTKIMKNTTRVVRPYSSVNENLYFRGIAATFKVIKNTELTVFGSKKNIDGNINEIQDDYENPAVFASSLQISGFHRLQSEIEGKHSINQKALGTRISYKNKSKHIGINLFYLNHDKPLIKQDKLYNKFKFSGQNLLNISVDYSYIFKRIFFFGEIARSKNNSYALLQGIQYIPSSKMEIAVLYRNYSKSYHSLNSNSFGETVGTNDETGIYFGVNMNLNRHWSMSFYHDVFKFPWLRYNVGSPGYGNEFFSILRYKKRHKYSFYIQFKSEVKTRDFRDDNYKINKTFDRQIKRLRLHQNIKVSKYWELRNRLEFSLNRQKIISSRGVMFYQDIVFKPMQFPYSFTFRYAMFDTDDYYSGIYAYENDILGESLIPVYFRKGFRTYINIRYRPNTNVMAEFRWAKWYFPDETGIGSGTEYINANHKTEVKMQLKLNF